MYLILTKKQELNEETEKIEESFWIDRVYNLLQRFCSFTCSGTFNAIGYFDKQKAIRIVEEYKKKYNAKVIGSFK